MKEYVLFEMSGQRKVPESVFDKYYNQDKQSISKKSLESKLACVMNFVEKVNVIKS